MNDFAYHCPASLAEAVRLLASDPSLRPFAGGTDVLPQMEEGSLCPAGLVDTKAIPELNVLAFDESRGLRLGAAAPLNRILQFTPVREHYLMLAEACALIGSELIRARATVGGNLCNAAPSADTAPPLLCLDARLVIAEPESERTIPLADFFLGPGQTALRPDEILVAIEAPPPLPQSSGAYLRHTPRAEMDIAGAGVAALIVFSDDGRACREARIALGAVAPTPIRAREAERVLAGREWTGTAIEQAAQAARAAARPIDDVRGAAWYRLELVGVLTERALRLARARFETSVLGRAA